MKLVTFVNPTLPGEQIGALLSGGRVLGLQQAAGLARLESNAFQSMQEFIDAGPSAMDQAGQWLDAPPQAAVLPLAECRLLAPLPRPRQIRDFLCFETHLRQSFEAGLRLAAAGTDDPATTEAQLRASGRFAIPDVWYRQPIYYKCNRFAISGPDDEIRWPDYSQVRDYELELAAVIGRGGRDIQREAAHEHIFGYTIFNDFSARDAQSVEMSAMLGPAKGKDFDGANAFGPCIVTADDVPDPYSLTMLARVNGEEWSRGNSATMHWTFADMIAHVSRSETLYPGEILGSGTVGNGCGLEQMRFLQPGDSVELEIEAIGVLRNRIGTT